MNCPYCGEPFDENGEWPVGDKGDGCHACWEAKLDADWWETVIAYDTILNGE